jgi:two-component system LytT family response regulator
VDPVDSRGIVVSDVSIVTRCGGGQQPVRIVNINLAQVERIEDADDHAVLHHGGRRNYVKVRLHELEAMLDPEGFARVHRSHIVNLDFVVACEPYDAWRLQAIMRSGERIVASRAGTRLLRSLVVG